MKREKFNYQINHSYGEGGLTCSFTDFQLSEFVQQKRRREGKLPVKKAVAEVGPQEDRSWALGPSLHFNSDGQLLDISQSKYTWIGHLYEGPKIAPQVTACQIQLPISTAPLKEMLMWAEDNLKHNFIPSVLVVGSFAMALHYTTFIKKFFFCPVPIAYSTRSGTGKTTALRMGLGVMGCHPSRFVSRASYEKYFDMCTTSYLPLAVDDPKSRDAVSDLAAALFNGAKEATVRRGEKNSKIHGSDISKFHSPARGKVRLFRLFVHVAIYTGGACMWNSLLYSNPVIHLVVYVFTYMNAGTYQGVYS